MIDERGRNSHCIWHKFLNECCVSLGWGLTYVGSYSGHKSHPLVAVIPRPYGSKPQSYQHWPAKFHRTLYTHTHTHISHTHIGLPSLHQLANSASRGQRRVQRPVDARLAMEFLRANWVLPRRVGGLQQWIRWLPEHSPLFQLSALNRRPILSSLVPEPI